ncbi:hypothetical protein T08_513 [Trichinella sp. T8]|nr:hypothetical protein T08_513 [Trichinella sp. T8]
MIIVLVVDTNLLGRNRLLIQLCCIDVQSRCVELLFQIYPISVSIPINTVHNRLCVGYQKMYSMTSFEPKKGKKNFVDFSRNGTDSFTVEIVDVQR